MTLERLFSAASPAVVVALDAALAGRELSVADAERLLQAQGTDLFALMQAADFARREDKGDDVSFVHQEVYKDNEVNKGLRPQLLKWRLASEPWTFIIGRDGRIAARFEGAVSVPELRAAVEKTL